MPTVISYPLPGHKRESPTGYSFVGNTACNLPRQVAVLAGAALCGLSASPKVSRAQCTGAGNRVTCQISNPRVDRVQVWYPNIRFMPGDRVTISAQGCVQTGGAGLTWKDYVHPKNRDGTPSTLYAGRVDVPGATDGLDKPVWRGLARFSDVFAETQPLVVGTNLDRATVLSLGYEDDQYSDNGYHGHDNGTGDQCKNVFGVIVKVIIERPGGIDAAAFDTSVSLRAPPVSVPRTALPDTGGASAGQVSQGQDSDKDGIPDGEEMVVAVRFAPVIYHEPTEPNWPIVVEDLFPYTRLGVRDQGCSPEVSLLPGEVTPQRLLKETYSSTCHGTMVPTVRDASKSRTFFLADVPELQRQGSPDGSKWPTYIHVYPNDRGGRTIQYWRAYAFNTGERRQILGTSVEFGFHGGDWEGIHVVLGPHDVPVLVRYLSHTTVDSLSWNLAPVEGDHTLVWSEPGGHASSPATPTKRQGRIRQETWPGGKVTWPDGTTQRDAALVQLGEKLSPAVPWLQYAGLWGSPGTLFSGYWGPAFNETAMPPSGFVFAWCAGIADPSRQIGAERECYPRTKP